MLMVSQNSSTAFKKLKISSLPPFYFLYILFISNDFIKQILLQCSPHVSYKDTHIAQGCSMLSYRQERITFVVRSLSLSTADPWAAPLLWFQ